MLDADRILSIIAQDKYSSHKKQARTGQRYYDGLHDILDYRVFYINKEGILVEDITKSNIRAPHPFFQEIAEQEVAYILSGGIVFQSSDKELEEYLGEYFDDTFVGEFQECLTDTVVRGSGYVYWYRDEKGRTNFCHADSLGIVEANEIDDTGMTKKYIIRYYPAAVKDGRVKMRVEVWDENRTYYYIQDGSSLIPDRNVRINPLPHLLYQMGDQYYYEEYGRLPFLRLDNNRHRQSGIRLIKPIIDDYDLMDCGLSNNLQDIAEGIYVVKGFKGENIDELVWKLKNRRIIGVSDKGGVDVHTVNIPYEARKTKMEADEKNIYRLALAFNAAQSGDGNITNIVIKSRYTLLDMKSKKLIIRIKKFLRQLLGVAIDEINETYGKSYDAADVKISISPVIPTDEKEDAEVRKLDAETVHEKIGIVLDAAGYLDSGSIIREICRVMELDENEVMTALEKDRELETALEELDGQIPETGTA